MPLSRALRVRQLLAWCDFKATATPGSKTVERNKRFLEQYCPADQTQTLTNGLKVNTTVPSALGTKAVRGTRLVLRQPVSQSERPSFIRSPTTVKSCSSSQCVTARCLAKGTTKSLTVRRALICQLVIERRLPDYAGKTVGRASQGQACDPHSGACCRAQQCTTGPE